MDCLGVTYGYGSAQELQEAGAILLANSVSALGHLLIG